MAHITDDIRALSLNIFAEVLGEDYFDAIRQFSP